MSETDRAVLFIGGGRSDSQDVTPERVGSKAYNLMRMDRAGLPVPPAFVLDTGFCRDFFARGGALPDDIAEVLAVSMRRLENATGRTFGGHRRPLLVSVRSGAPVSMPGMMESLLDVGLNDATVHGLVRATGNPRLAWDSYRRFVETYAAVVYRHPLADLDRAVARRLDPDLFPGVGDLDAPLLRELTLEQIERVGARRGQPFPQDCMQQLVEAVAAVLRSWRSAKAEEYRRLNRLDESMGTAVTVQAMVFGNAGGTSGSGVGFTRDPATGSNEIYLDFLFNAQGEDVVSGRRAVSGSERLAVVLPEVHARLARVKTLLESEFRDLQDFEFTVQEGELYLLQTRSAKRTPWAALHVAVDLVEQGLITPADGLERLADVDLGALERVHLAGAGGETPLAAGTPASIGVAVGAVALDSDRARAAAGRGKPVVLVRDEISTDDIAGLAAADGILTATGGRTSHAAVVARQMGKVCLVGCGDLRIDLARRRLHLGGATLDEGAYLSLDGNTGDVYAGRLAVERERPGEALARVERWRAGTAAVALTTARARARRTAPRPRHRTSRP